MRFRAQIILPFLFASFSLFSQKGIEIGVQAGLLIDLYKVLDGGQQIKPQADDSNSFSILVRKKIAKNFKIESGITYKYIKGDFLHRNFLKDFNHLNIPVSLYGHFELSKKNKIFLVPSVSAYYISESLGLDSNSTNGFTRDFQWRPHEPNYRYHLNSTFSGNTFGVAGEIALEFVVFSKLTFHLGYQYSTAFRDTYINNLEYKREDSDTFTATISSKNENRGYNISFYYPIGAQQKN